MAEKRLVAIDEEQAKRFVWIADAIESPDGEVRFATAEDLTLLRSIVEAWDGAKRLQHGDRVQFGPMPGGRWEGAVVIEDEPAPKGGGPHSLRPGDHSCEGCGNGGFANTRPERVTLHICAICGVGYFDNAKPDDVCFVCGTEAEAIGPVEMVAVDPLLAWLDEQIEEVERAATKYMANAGQPDLFNDGAASGLRHVRAYLTEGNRSDG